MNYDWDNYAICEHGKKTHMLAICSEGPWNYSWESFCFRFWGALASTARPAPTYWYFLWTGQSKIILATPGNCICVCVMSHFIGVFVPKKKKNPGWIESVKVTTNMVRCLASVWNWPLPVFFCIAAPPMPFFFKTEKLNKTNALPYYLPCLVPYFFKKIRIITSHIYISTYLK